MLKEGSGADACPPTSREDPVPMYALRPDARTLLGRVLPGAWVHLLQAHARRVGLESASYAVHLGARPPSYIWTCFVLTPARCPGVLPGEWVHLLPG